MAEGRRLSDNVGFATIKESLPNSAASLMDYTRDTLRRAKEIANTLEEADRVAEEAWRRAEEIIQETREDPGWAETTEEDRPGDLEAALVLKGAAEAAGAVGGGGNTRPMSPKEKEKQAGAQQQPAAAANRETAPSSWGENHKEGREGRLLAAEMREQITGSVMWVQQLLELVNTAESKATFHPGESLAKPSSVSLFGDAEDAAAKHEEDGDATKDTDRNLPKLKEMALLRSQEKYQEKKADEKAEEDELSVFFRNSALSQVTKAAAGRRG